MANVKDYEDKLLCQGHGIHIPEVDRFPVTASSKPIIRWWKGTDTDGAIFGTFEFSHFVKVLQMDKQSIN